MKTESILQMRCVSGSPPVVLHVAPITHTQASGLAFAIPMLVGALSALRVPTGMLTTSPNGPYGIPQPFPVVDIRDLPRCQAIARMPPPLNRPDLIVFHSTYIPAHAILAHEARRTRIPYVIAPHGGMTRWAQRIKGTKKAMGNLLFFKTMVRHSIALQCLTEGEAEDVRAWQRPVFVVGNAVELPSIDTLASPGSQAGLRFVFLGRLDIEIKGLDLLLEACAMAHDELRAARVEVHLYGPDVSLAQSRIARFVTTHTIEDLVHVHEAVHGQAKQDVLRQADLFLHTSRSEGHPMAVLEALSCGVPCLLTPGTHMAEVLAANGAGWACGPSSEAIAAAMRVIIKARSELPIRGQAARTLAEEKYAPHQVAVQLLDAYSRLLKGSHAYCDRKPI